MAAGTTWLRVELAAGGTVRNRQELGRPTTGKRGLESKPEATGSISALCTLRLRTQQDCRRRPARSLPIEEE